MAGVIGSEAVFQVTGNDGRYLLISVWQAQTGPC